MRAIVRTILGIRVQTALNLGLLLDMPLNSTINEVLTDPDVVPFQPNPPTLGMEFAAAYDMNTDSENVHEQLLVIGNRGHVAASGGTYGIDTMDAVPHLATDTGLFGMIPFVIRPFSDDLTPALRQIYRLRKTMWYNGELYVAYYGRKLVINSVVPEMTITDVSNGVSQTRPFVPTINNLKPKPRPIDGEGDGSYVEVVANIGILFGDQEIEWLKEVGQIMFGDPNKGLISELAFCSCVEKPVTTRYPGTGPQNPSNVAPGERFESVAVQVNTFVSTFLTPNLNGGFGGTYNLGGNDPLYQTSTDPSGP